MIDYVHDRELSAKGQELLAMMPPYFSDAPYVQTIIDAHARELQRIEDAAAAVLRTMFPATADDTYGFLSLWESILGLPVAPGGTTLAARRAKVLAGLQKQNAGAGSGWIALMNEALGGSPWAYVEANPVTDPYEVHIFIPFAGGSYSAEQVATLARQITPAHLDVIVAYDEGFLVGISQIGVEAL
jgi:hypothetical protein